MRIQKRIIYFLALFCLAPLLLAQGAKKPSEIKLQYYNSPSSWLILPECIWAPATGGGTWITELQICSVSDTAEVYAAFVYGGGNYRGPFLIASLLSAGQVWISNNILETLQSIDPDFTYYGKVGALIIATDDSINGKILALAKTKNGPYGKTLPALTDVDANFCSAEPFRPMVIAGLVSNANYRSSVGGVNFSNYSIEIYFELHDADGNIIGSPFVETFVGFDFKAFNPFNKAGVPYPGNSFDNAYLLIFPESGAGRAMFFGAVTNNSTNDPATILPFQLR